MEAVLLGGQPVSFAHQDVAAHQPVCLTGLMINHAGSKAVGVAVVRVIRLLSMLITKAKARVSPILAPKLLTLTILKAKASPRGLVSTASHVHW